MASETQVTNEETTQQFNDLLLERYNEGKEKGKLLIVGVVPSNVNWYETVSIEDSDDEDDDIKNLEDNNNIIGKMKCNPMCLMRASVKLNKMIQFGMQTKGKEIEIKTYCLQDLDDFIYFVITGHLRDDVNLGHLYEMGNYYEVALLMETCRNKLVERLNDNNFVDLFVFCDFYGFDVERKELVKYGQKHLKTLRQTRYWNKLPAKIRQELGDDE